jgi:hypothetical protein
MIFIASGSPERTFSESDAKPTPLATRSSAM